MVDGQGAVYERSGPNNGEMCRALAPVTPLRPDFLASRFPQTAEQGARVAVDSLSEELRQPLTIIMAAREVYQRLSDRGRLTPPMSEKITMMIMGGVDDIAKIMQRNTGAADSGDVGFDYYEGSREVVLSSHRHASSRYFENLRDGNQS